MKFHLTNKQPRCLDERLEMMVVLWQTSWHLSMICMCVCNPSLVYLCLLAWYILLFFTIHPSISFHFITKILLVPKNNINISQNIEQNHHHHHCCRFFFFRFFDHFDENIHHHHFFECYVAVCMCIWNFFSVLFFKLPKLPVFFSLLLLLFFLLLFDFPVIFQLSSFSLAKYGCVSFSSFFCVVNCDDDVI